MVQPGPCGPPSVYNHRERTHSFQRWHKRTVSVKWIADDTIEIEENDYYIYLGMALLHASEHKVLSFEEPELTADDDLIEREVITDMQHNIPKRSRRMAATAGDFLFY